MPVRIQSAERRRRLLVLEQIGHVGDSGGIPPDSANGHAGHATAIATGSDHSCAIQKETGAVICWARISTAS